jgi:methylated-DNA-[protein]-cysteine S-methyltransferase
MSRKPTAFETRIYELTRCIPRGSVTTYGELARAAGCGSARAVGQALSRNPFAPVVPCHRVIASDMKPGGFQGQAMGDRVRSKLDLLADEGCRFVEGRLVDRSRLFRFGR